MTVKNKELQSREAQTPCDAARTWREPRWEMQEAEDGWLLNVEMPGVAKSGVDLTINNGTLSLTGARSASKGESWRAIHREADESDYRIIFSIKEKVLVDNISAEMEYGRLKVRFPKKEAADKRTIKVR